jgi:DNA-binding response OmpR family regulator
MNDKKTILVADDDLAILDVTKIMLEDYGPYHVLQEENGEKLFPLSSPYPDLILLDLWLSGYSGQDICQKLKSDDRTKHIPIIIFSAGGNLREIAGVCGADDYLAKPFQMEELLMKVSSWLK